MSSIDEKYNKYVLKGSAVESVQGSKANKFISKGSIEEYPNTGKSSHYQYQDYTQWNRENQ